MEVAAADPRASLLAAVRRLSAMATELRRFVDASERVFLDAGLSLQRLEGKAHRMLTESSNATQMGKGTDTPVERLRRGLGRIDDLLHRGRIETEEGLKALTTVLGGIERLAGLEASFQSIVATLQALASTTRIENSRSNMHHGAFDSVVTDLRNMAAVMRPKFDEVLAQSRMVRLTAEAARLEARSFLDKHSREAARLHTETDKHLLAMTAACNTAKALAAESSSDIAKVHAHISKVLQALQVQDISRQIIDHVIEDLRELEAGVEEARKNTDGGMSDERACSWLAELALVSRIGSAHIRNACNRLVTGLAQIDRSMQVVVATLAGLAKESSAFSGAGNESSILQRLERGIRETKQTLQEHEAQEATMVQALGKVAASAAGVEGLVDEVARLGQDARFIGLNAMVKAVRVGQAGMTLTVLAREIQDMSAQIQTFTSAAADIMRAMGDEARLLVGRQHEGGEQANNSDGRAAAVELDTLMTELGTYQSSLQAAVEMLLTGSRDLGAEVTATSRGLGSLIAKAEELRGLADELAEVERHAQRDSRGAKPPEERRHLDNLRYTMEEERRVHKAALTAETTHEEIPKPADGSSEGSIEFF